MTSGDITGIFQGLVRSCQDYRAKRAAMREYEALDPILRDELAADIGFSTTDLDDIVHRGGGADTLMTRMLAEFGLDADALCKRDRILFRDIEVRCSKCTHKSRCARELDAGTAADHARDFCRNAETFEALV